MSKYLIVINSREYEVEVKEDAGGRARVTVDGEPFELELRDALSVKPVSVSPPPAAAPPVEATPHVAPSRPAPAAVPVATQPGAILAPMPGVVLEVLVSVGQRVKPGDVVMRIEAMKMENDIKATAEGVVKEIMVEKGTQVQEKYVLMVLGE